MLSKVRYYILQGWPTVVEDKFEMYKQKQKLLSIDQNVILWDDRILIPETLKVNVLKVLHQNYLGIVKMKSIARGHVWWSKIN